MSTALVLDKARAWRRPEGARPWVLGHRGARHAAPENTLRAFSLAADEGADGIELDVRLDGDGEVIVLHDKSLARVTDKRDKRRAESLSTRELAHVDVGLGEHVPTLREVLELAKSRSLRVNVELKHDVSTPGRLVEGVAELLRAQPDAPDWLLLSSFHPWIVIGLTRALPELPVAWLVHARQQVLRFAPMWRRLGASGVHPEHVLISARRMEKFRRGGAIINAWTVNEVERARSLAALGVDSIISDSPGLILAAIAPESKRSG